MKNSPYKTEFADEDERQADAELWKEACDAWDMRVKERRQRIAGERRLAALGAATHPDDPAGLLEALTACDAELAEISRIPWQLRNAEQETRHTWLRQQSYELRRRCRRLGIDTEGVAA